jgi:hypothetical protein
MFARATKGDMTPAGEKFCEILRRLGRASRAKGPADNKLCATKAEAISLRI